MARKQLTIRWVETAKPPATGRLEVFDTVTTGLALRITEHGAKSWSVLYRLDGRLQRYTIGPYPRVGLAEARRRAKDALELVGQGKDPREKAKAERAAEAKRRGDTVAHVAESFLTLYAAERRWPDLESIIRRELVAEWGSRPISGILRSDALDLLATIKKRAPVRANRALTVLKLFFGWAVEHEYVTGSPVAAISKPTREVKRERVLTEVEIRAFWRACAALGWPHGPLCQLLLLTAARRDEIGGLRWSEFSRAKALIEIPGKRIKGSRAHVIPLAPAAMTIIGDLPAIADSAFVFTRNGATPVTDFSKTKTKLDALMLAGIREAAGDDTAELSHWTLHDLRRSARTEMSRIGINADVAERVLGHAIGGVRGIYDRYEFLPEKKAALERWAAHLDGIINLPDGDKVVALRR